MGGRARRARNSKRLPRWIASKFDKDRLEAGTVAAFWALISDNFGVAVFMDRITEALTDICDCAMPRAASTGGRNRPIYW